MTRRQGRSKLRAFSSSSDDSVSRTRGRERSASRRERSVSLRRNRDRSSSQRRGRERSVSQRRVRDRTSSQRSDRERSVSQRRVRDRSSSQRRGRERSVSLRRNRDRSSSQRRGRERSLSRRRDRSVSLRRNRERSSSRGGGRRSDPKERARIRFDSPPKESAIIANLHGLTDDASTFRQMRELTAINDAQANSAKAEQLRLAKELYVGNIPQGIPIFSLIDRLNDLLVEMGATTMPGKPILSGWLGGDSQFAFLQLRTVEECNHALALNGYSFDGYQLKVGRPRGALGNGGGPVSVAGPASQFSLDDLPGVGITIHPPLEESSKTEMLVLAGAPLGAIPDALRRILSEYGDLKHFETVEIPHINRKSVLFEYSDAKSQRILALKSLVYDRDYPLAVTRIEDAISAGFLHIQDQQFTRGAKVISPTRIVWLTNLPPIPLGLDQDLISEVSDTCRQFGTVKSVALHRPPKAHLRGVYGILSDPEPVVVVEFESTKGAVMCTRYLSGASCFYLNESKFDNSDFTYFEQNFVDDPALVCTPDAPVDPPRISGGKIISAEADLISAFKAKKKLRLAPEDMEVID